MPRFGRHMAIKAYRYKVYAKNVVTKRSKDRTLVREEGSPAEKPSEVADFEGSFRTVSPNTLW